MRHIDEDVVYNASPTLAKFHLDHTSFFRGIRGPVGGGKSTGCSVEILHRGMMQAPRKGVRYTRWLGIRNTYDELRSTTIPTFEDWMPPGHFKTRTGNQLDTTVKYPLKDGTLCHIYVKWAPLDREEDSRKALGLEVTGAWLNEYREIPWGILKVLVGRIGRYPSEKHGGPTWSGIIADTNPPDDQSPWFEAQENTRPEGYAFYTQPPAMLYKQGQYEGGKRFQDGVLVPNPAAENIANLPGGYDYYRRQMSSMDDNAIRVYILNQYGSTFTGKPVYDGHYNDTFHVSKEPLPIIKGLPIYLGFDFGLTPACVVAQVTGNGVLHVLREFWFERGGIRQFVESDVIPELSKEFGGMKMVSVGDPAGAAGNETDIDQNPINELRRMGIPTEAAPTNDFETRRDAVYFFLDRVVDGKAAILLDPSCKMLREGFRGGYQFERVKSSGSMKYRDKPKKDSSTPYSHMHDALQYLCMRVRSPLIADARGRRHKDITPQRNTWAGATM